MQRLGILDWQHNLSFRSINLLDGEPAHTLLSSLSFRSSSGSSHSKTRLCSNLRHADLNVTLQSLVRQCSEIQNAVHDNIEELLDEEDDLCPVECVREFKTDEEFSIILEKAKKAGSLVVVDFYRTACGSCKYIEQGFAKLCRGAGDEQAPVIFLKHNVSTILDIIKEGNALVASPHLKYHKEHFCFSLNFSGAKVFFFLNETKDSVNNNSHICR